MDSSEVCDALSCHFPLSCVESLPIFEVWRHSSMTYFPVHVVCLHFPLFAGGRCLKGRWRLVPQAPCLPQAPHFTRGSWVGRQGLQGPGAQISCQRGGGAHIDLTVTFIASRQAQSSRGCSRQVPIQDWEQGSLLSSFAAVPVVSFHVWVVTLTFSFLQCLVLSEGSRRCLNGRRTGLDQDMAYVWKAFHVSCWNAWAEQIAWLRVFWKCFVLGTYRFFYYYY